MADVYFKAHNPLVNRVEMVKEAIDRSGILSAVHKGDMVAVKLHIGEIGNPYHVDPLITRTVVQCIRARGGDPFITDTTSYYVYMRHNALDFHRTATAHGFVPEAVGAPFIVADGLGASPGVRLAGKGILKEVFMAELFAESAFLFVLSHCKGHSMTGFGGALKNIGMGCVTKRTKLAAHRVVDYSIDRERCTGCGKCHEVCPWHFPEIVDGKAVNDSPHCMRCPICQDHCPAGAIKLGNVEKLQHAVAGAACSVLSLFKGKTAFLNVATGISRYCDCFDAPGDILVKDTGYFASNDGVAADMAFLQKVGPGPFREAHGVDPTVQIHEAERLGGGSTEVNLVEI